jgi:hypothetical protein
MVISRGGGGFNPWQRRPQQAQRGVSRMPSANPRAIAALKAYEQQSRVPVNFDMLYRHLMESGFTPNDAHLAAESYWRGRPKR